MEENHRTLPECGACVAHSCATTPMAMTRSGGGAAAPTAASDGASWSAALQRERRLVGGELDDVAGARLCLDAKQVSLHGRADVHLQLPIADRPRHLGVRLQLEAVLDVEIADDGAVDDRVAAADRALDVALGGEDEERRRLGVDPSADDVAAHAPVDAHAARECDVAVDLDAFGDERRELRRLDERLPFRFSEHRVLLLSAWF